MFAATTVSALSPGGRTARPEDGSALDLIAPLLTVSVVPGTFDTGARGDAEIAVLANFLPPTTTTTVTQRPGLPQTPSVSAGQTPEKAPEKEENNEEAEADLPIWAQLASGLERAWGETRARMLHARASTPTLPTRPRRHLRAPAARPRKNHPIVPAVRLAILRPKKKKPLYAKRGPSNRGPSPASRTSFDVIDAAIEERAS